MVAAEVATASATHTMKSGVRHLTARSYTGPSALTASHEAPCVTSSARPVTATSSAYGLSRSRKVPV